MIKTENFDKPILIEYKRKGFKRVTGVVVAIGPGIIGWSLCKHPDVFHKQKGFEIALGRAKRVAELGPEDETEYYDKMPFSLHDLALKMHERSVKYFKVSE